MNAVVSPSNQEVRRLLAIVGRPHDFTQHSPALRDEGLELPQIVSHMFMSISSLYASWTHVHTFRAKNPSLNAGESILVVNNVNRADEQPEVGIAPFEVANVEMWYSTRFNAAVDFVKATDGTTLVIFTSSYADVSVHMLCVQFQECEERKLNLKVIFSQIEYAS